MITVSCVEDGSTYGFVTETAHDAMNKMKYIRYAFVDGTFREDIFCKS